MQRGRLGGIEPRGFRNVCQRPYNRWPEAHACKSHTHALGSPLRWPPAHPTRKRVLAGRQAGWSAECQQCVWDTKMRQKRKPLARKCVQNTYLEAESRFRSVAAWSGSRTKPQMILSQNCIDFDTKTNRFGHISGPSYRGAHGGWPAGWLVGWLAGWLAGAPKKRQKRVPFIRKCVKNAYP